MFRRGGVVGDMLTELTMLIKSGNFPLFVLALVVVC